MRLHLKRLIPGADFETPTGRNGQPTSPFGLWRG
jgi:hypothetical protein